MGQMQRYLNAILFILCVSIYKADHDVGTKKVPVLLNEEDARNSRKSTFGTDSQGKAGKELSDSLGISINDLLYFPSGIEAPLQLIEVALTAGDEYTPELSSES